MLLSDVDIKRGLENGSILIDPFNEKQLGNVSYDLTVGHTIARFSKPNNGQIAHPASFDTDGLFNVEMHSHGFIISPQERILAHTREFAGGTGKLFKRNSETGEDLAVTSYLQATSTAARLGLTACLCAGWGDVGYCNRWTLEVLNVSPYTIYLPVGAVIAQICFESVAMPAKIYGKDTGSYQNSLSVDQLRQDWDPLKHMLPKKLKVYP